MTRYHSPQQWHYPEFLPGLQLQHRHDPYRQQDDSSVARYHPDDLSPEVVIDPLVHTWHADSVPSPAAHAA